MEPLTKELVAAIRAERTAQAGMYADERAVDLCDSHERLRERVAALEAERDELLLRDTFGPTMRTLEARCERLTRVVEAAQAFAEAEKHPESSADEYDALMAACDAAIAEPTQPTEGGDDVSHYELADWLLARAQEIVEQLQAANDDTQYGLLKAAHDHIISARGDLDADMK